MAWESLEQLGDATWTVPWGWAWLAVGALVVVVFLLLWNLKLLSLVQDLSSSANPLLEEQLHSAERALERAREDFEHLDREHRFVTQFIRELPSLSQELRSGVGTRRLPQVLLHMMTVTFQPHQALVIFRRRRSASPGNSEASFNVAATYPANSNVKIGTEIVPGKGVLGYVAESQRAMLGDEIQQETSMALEKLRRDNLEGFPTDAAAPMVFDDKTVGVLAISGPREKSPLNKEVLRLIAQMGALTYYNVMAYGHMKRTADLDKLTGVLNKASITKILAQEILQAQNNGSRLSIFLFDIDNFKNYNDVNGHLAGDKLLTQLANLVRSRTGVEDIFGRFGGEEFLLVLPDTELDDAQKVAERIRELIAEHPFDFAENQPLGCVSVSGGIAGYPYTANDSRGLLQAADQALYQAKAQGRNCVVKASPKYFGIAEEGKGVSQH